MRNTINGCRIVKVVDKAHFTTCRIFFRAVDKGRYFTHREFSFTIEGDIYLRYQSFQDRKEFEDALKTQNPHKIDIGAIYNIKVVCVCVCVEIMHPSM